jgi:hypothetical protein
MSIVTPLIAVAALHPLIGMTMRRDRALLLLLASCVRAALSVGLGQAAISGY